MLLLLWIVCRFVLLWWVEVVFVLAICSCGTGAALGWFAFVDFMFRLFCWVVICVVVRLVALIICLLVLGLLHLLDLDCACTLVTLIWSLGLFISFIVALCCFCFVSLVECLFDYAI